MDQKFYADTRFVTKNSEENLNTAVNVVVGGLEKGRTYRQHFEEYFRIYNFKSVFLMCFLGELKLFIGCPSFHYFEI